MFTLRFFAIITLLSFSGLPVGAQDSVNPQGEATQTKTSGSASQQETKPAPQVKAPTTKEASQGSGSENEAAQAEDVETAETQAPAEEPPKEDENLFDIAAKGGVMMIPLLLLGLLGMTLVIERSIFHYKNKSWQPERIRADLEKIAEAKDVRYSEDLEKRLTEARDLYMDKLERGMGLIQGVGNIAPLLGFLGTVIGMINAFSAIAAARTVNAKVVASGIQVALVTTAGGLLVAVPILAAFYFLNHINQNHYLDINRWIAELTKKFPSVLNAGQGSGEDRPHHGAGGDRSSEGESGGSGGGSSAPEGSHS